MTSQARLSCYIVFGFLATRGKPQYSSSGIRCVIQHILTFLIVHEKFRFDIHASLKTKWPKNVEAKFRKLRQKMRNFSESRNDGKNDEIKLETFIYHIYSNGNYFLLHTNISIDILIIVYLVKKFKYLLFFTTLFIHKHFLYTFFKYTFVILNFLI